MKKLSNVLIAIAVLTAVIAGIVSVFQINTWYLAGTQWMMIAILFGIFAIFAEIRNNKI